ncbi:MAG: cation:proton antiporter [Acidimicrobiales bacterium]
MPSEGFVVLAATLATYGVTELVHGYGFLAVFVAACMIRAQERDHAYHEVLHSVAESTERLLSAALLVLLGAAIVEGVLSGLGWRGAVTGLIIVLVLRPLAGFMSLSRVGTGRGERMAVAFFGIRGIGSIYYLAHALNEATSPTHRRCGPSSPLSSLSLSCCTESHPFRSCAGSTTDGSTPADDPASG